MTVACNVKDCAYNSSGVCAQKYYVIIKNGQCSWLINNKNYMTRIDDPYEPQDCSLPNCDIPVKKKRGRPKKIAVENNSIE